MTQQSRVNYILQILYKFQIKICLSTKTNNFFFYIDIFNLKLIDQVH